MFWAWALWQRSVDGLMHQTIQNLNVSLLSFLSWHEWEEFEELIAEEQSFLLIPTKVTIILTKMVCKASWQNFIKNTGNMTSCACLIIMFSNTEKHGPNRSFISHRHCKKTVIIKAKSNKVWLSWVQSLYIILLLTISKKMRVSCYVGIAVAENGVSNI